MKDTGGFSEWRTVSQDSLCSVCIFSLSCIYPQRESSIPFSWICCDGFEVRHFSSFSMTYWLQQCSNSNQLTNGFSLWMTMWGLARPRTVTFKCTFKANILQVHSKWHLLEPQCATDACFCLSPSGRLFISLWKEHSDLHSALRSRTITAHLNSNWSRHEDIRHGECSESSLSRPLWMFQEVLYILMCWMRVVTCTAKKESAPPEHPLTHTPLNARHWMVQCVDHAPLGPYEPLLHTDTDWPGATVDLCRRGAL